MEALLALLVVLGRCEDPLDEAVGAWGLGSLHMQFWIATSDLP